MTSGNPHAQALSFARQAIDEMERRQAWPTPLNYALWLEGLQRPEGPAGRVLRQLTQSGEPLTEAAVLSAALAAPDDPAQAGAAEADLQAGERLRRELAEFADALADARQSNVDFETTLEQAAHAMAGVSDGPALSQVLAGLAADTRQLRSYRDALQSRLDVSTTEVARLRRRVARSRREARIDALTGLPNRQASDLAVDAACQAAHAAGRPLVLAMLDIDHFKRFNDTFGHQTGDQVLRYVGKVSARIAAAPRLAARFGGEEFVLMFPGETAAVAALAVQAMLDEICGAALKRRSSNQDLGAVTLSAGLAQLRRGETGEDLTERADQALYASKPAGRNRLTCA